MAAGLPGGNRIRGLVAGEAAGRVIIGGGRRVLRRSRDFGPAQVKRDFIEPVRVIAPLVRIDDANRARWNYRSRPMALLLDENTSHTGEGSQSLAEDLDIQSLWLPGRSPHLNPMDHLWGHGKARVRANYQQRFIEDQTRCFIDFTMSGFRRPGGAKRACARQISGFTLQYFTIADAVRPSRVKPGHRTCRAQFVAYPTIRAVSLLSGMAEKFGFHRSKTPCQAIPSDFGFLGFFSPGAFPPLFRPIQG